MFGWLLRRIGLKQTGLWSARERAIFRFWDGRRRRRVDPLAVEAALRKHGGDDWHRLILSLNELDPATAGKLPPTLQLQHANNRRAAGEQLAAITRASFGIEPLSDRGGLTVTETFDVLADYLSYMTMLGEAVAPFVIPSNVSPAPSGGDSTTAPSLASTSGDKGTAINDSPEPSPVDLA
jgi:hypothetical protein